LDVTEYLTMNTG